jgi:hypothetical protein
MYENLSHHLGEKTLSSEQHQINKKWEFGNADDEEGNDNVG